MHIIDHQNILLLLPARLGDTLFYTPTIALLKKYHPHATVDALVLSPLAASVLADNPHIGRVYISPDENTVAQLNAQYDLVINLHHDVDTCDYLKKFTCAQLCAPVADPLQHQCAQSIAFLAEQLGVSPSEQSHQYTLYPQIKHHQEIAHYLTDANQTIWIGLHLGCHGLAKRSWNVFRTPAHRKVWPLKSFQQLAKQLQQHDPRIRFVLTGSKNEMILGEKFCRQVPGTLNLMDKTSVQSLAALMDRLALFITSDTGALHVACATSVRLIALFGPTSLTRTGPFPLRNHHIILQKTDMSAIRVAEVYEAVVALNGG